MSGPVAAEPFGRVGDQQVVGDDDVVLGGEGDASLERSLDPDVSVAAVERGGVGVHVVGDRKAVPDTTRRALGLVDAAFLT